MPEPRQATSCDVFESWSVILYYFGVWGRLREHWSKSRHRPANYRHIEFFAIHRLTNKETTTLRLAAGIAHSARSVRLPNSISAIAIATASLARYVRVPSNPGCF
jgi:hypothetical protein